MSIELVHTIGVDEYNNLRKSVDWLMLNERQAQKGIDNTFYLVCAKSGEEAVGMARVISDGGYVVYIADVIVNPAYQGLGVGRMIMENIVSFIKKDLVVNGPVMVNLMSAQGKEDFYKNFGFVTRPNEEVGAGMFLWMK